MIQMATTRFFNVDDVSIGYDVTGSGHPLVLLHAGIGDRSMWDDQIEPFAEHYTVVRFDARGFGETCRTAAEFQSWRDVTALLDHLGFDRAHLVGVSMGSQTALDVAVAAPDRVSALVVVSARTGIPVSDDLRAGWQAVDDLITAGDIDGANEYELRMWVDGPNRSPDAVPARVRERVREMNGALLVRDDTEDNEQESDPPTEAGLAGISCPTLVVWGDQDVADVLAAGPKLAATIAGAKQAVIGNAAHLPQMERPGEFNTVVLDFLATAPSS
jgi:pimeloyl-ACP methyl ester carboxylesterase